MPLGRTPASSRLQPTLGLASLGFLSAAVAADPANAQTPPAEGALALPEMTVQEQAPSPYRRDDRPLPRPLGQRDPASVGHTVLPEHVVPAAVFLAQILGHVADVEQLGRVLVRIVVGADDDVWAAAHVGCDRRLGPQVLPVLALQRNRHAGRLAELPGVGGPGVLVALDEALPAQEAQLGPLLRRVAQRRRTGGRVASEDPSPARRQHPGAQRLQSIAPGHLALLRCKRQEHRRCPETPQTPRNASPVDPVLCFARAHAFHSLHGAE